MNETYDIRACQEQPSEQLRALYSAGTLVYDEQPLFDLYISHEAHERLAVYLPRWVDRDDIQWSYMGYSFENDSFVVGFSGATIHMDGQGDGGGEDVNGYYLFEMVKGEPAFLGLGLARRLGVYGKLMKGLKAMFPDLIDLQLD